MFLNYDRMELILVSDDVEFPLAFNKATRGDQKYSG